MDDPVEAGQVTHLTSVRSTSGAEQRLRAPTLPEGRTERMCERALCAPFALPLAYTSEKIMSISCLLKAVNSGSYFLPLPPESALVLTHSAMGLQSASERHRGGDLKD